MQCCNAHRRQMDTETKMNKISLVLNSSGCPRQDNICAIKWATTHVVTYVDTSAQLQLDDFLLHTEEDLQTSGDISRILRVQPACEEPTTPLLQVHQTHGAASVLNQPTEQRSLKWPRWDGAQRRSRAAFASKLTTQRAAWRSDEVKNITSQLLCLLRASAPHFQRPKKCV